MRTGHYATHFGEWFAKYRITPVLPHVPTCKVRVAGVETIRCTWCYHPTNP